MLKQDRALKELGRNFVVNMTHIRKEEGMSKTALAKKAGISRSTIFRIEKVRKTRFGKGQVGYLPTLRTVAKICAVTELGMDDLLGTRL